MHREYEIRHFCNNIKCEAAGEKCMKYQISLQQQQCLNHCVRLTKDDKRREYKINLGLKMLGDVKEKAMFLSCCLHDCH